MNSTKAILKVNNQKYSILRFSHRFQRDVDEKGRLCSHTYGGEIFVQIESTEDTELFRLIVSKEMLTANGSIEVFEGDDEVCVKRIEFEKAYIYQYTEEMQRAGPSNMTTNIAITPMRLDINNKPLRLDRRWPQAPFGWQEYEEEVVHYVKEKSTPNIRITDAYWIDEKGNKVRELVTNNAVTLYVAIEDCTIGQSVYLTFEDEDNMGIRVSAKCSGKVNKDGVLGIENFKMKKRWEE